MPTRPSNRELKAVVGGTFFQQYYYRVDRRCPLCSNGRQGVNIDYMLFLLHAARIKFVRYPVDINGSFGDMLEVLANGTVDISWEMWRIDPVDKPHSIWTLPATSASYGYVVNEDTSLVRDSFLLSLFSINSTAFFGLLSFLGFYTTLLSIVPEPHRRHMEFPTLAAHLLRQFRQRFWGHQHQRGSISLLVAFFCFLPALISLGSLFQSNITVALSNYMLRGYAVNHFEDVLSSAASGRSKALSWPKFRLDVYGSAEQRKRWEELRRGGAVVDLPGHEDAYYERLRKFGVGGIGFATTNDDILQRQHVTVLNKERKQLFVADSLIAPRNFGYMVSKRRPELREALNKAIAETRPLYGRMMTRYVSPLFAYSKKAKEYKMEPLSLFSVAQLFVLLAVLWGIATIIFVAERVLGTVLRKERRDASFEFEILCA